MDRGAEATEVLELMAIQFPQFGQGMAEDFRRDRRLNVRRLGLDTLVTDSRKLTQLIHHAPRLASHPKAAGLAGVLSLQGLRRILQADTAGGLQRVEHLLGAAADGGLTRVGKRIGSAHALCRLTPAGPARGRMQSGVHEPEYVSRHRIT